MRNDGRGGNWNPVVDEIAKTDFILHEKRLRSNPGKCFAKVSSRSSDDFKTIQPLLNNRLRVRGFLLVIGKLNTMLPPRDCAVTLENNY